MRRTAPTLLLIVAGVCPGLASGHEIPDGRIDRSTQATVRPGRLTIDYEVSLTDSTLAEELRRLIGDLPQGDRQALFDRFGRETAPLNARGFAIAVDGQPVDLAPHGFDLAVVDHPHYTFHFDAPLPARGKLTIRDNNYPDAEGMSRLALRGRDGVVIRGDDGPEDVAEVPFRPVWQLSDAEERRTKQIAVEFDTAPTIVPKAVAERPHRPRESREWTSGTVLGPLLINIGPFRIAGFLLAAAGLWWLGYQLAGYGRRRWFGILGASVLAAIGLWLLFHTEGSTLDVPAHNRPVSRRGSPAEADPARLARADDQRQPDRPRDAR